MDFFKFFLSKTFLKQLLILAGILIVLLVISSFWLKLYTHHGKYITVPDFSGLQYNEVDDYAKQRNLKAVIIDSIYDNSKIKGSVVSQDPLPNSLVKQNRKIYLTIISLSKEMIKMPDLKDLTLRQAVATLETYGLKSGSLTYVPHIALNAVLKQEYKGREISKGTLIEKGSKISLVLGSGLKDEKITIPFLLGKSRDEAINMLHAASLNVGGEFYEEGATESKAYVYKQKPVFSEHVYVNMGTTIDLWYKPKADFDIQMMQQQLLQEQNATEK